MKPEERIRQALVYTLVHEYEYPKELIVIEKELAQLPGVHRKIPKRRLDVLVYGKHEGDLLPLLLIECKAANVTHEALQQVLGYNHVVRAPYVAVVGKCEVLMCTADGEKVGGLMPYTELVSRLCKH